MASPSINFSGAPDHVCQAGKWTCLYLFFKKIDRIFQLVKFADSISFQGIKIGTSIKNSLKRKYDVLHDWPLCAFEISRYTCIYSAQTTLVLIACKFKSWRHYFGEKGTTQFRCPVPPCCHIILQIAKQNKSHIKTRTVEHEYFP